MAEFDAAMNTTHIRIVYYGVAMGGKTANLQFLHAKTSHLGWGDLRSEAGEAYRRLFMDMGSPILHGDYRFMFHLITTPGCVLYERMRTRTLENVDGVVFVVDSRKEKMEENVMYVKELVSVLQSYGKNLRTFPVVIQFNKRDLPGALPESILSRYLNPLGWPTVASIASEGVGVTETFQVLTSLVINSLLPQEATPTLVQKE